MPRRMRCIRDCPLHHHLLFWREMIPTDLVMYSTNAPEYYWLIFPSSDLNQTLLMFVEISFLTRKMTFAPVRGMTSNGRSM